jgi:hypothetical protein
VAKAHLNKAHGAAKDLPAPVYHFTAWLLALMNKCFIYHKSQNGRA